MLSLEKLSFYLPYGITVEPTADFQGQSGEAKRGEKFTLSPKTLYEIIDGNYDKVKLHLRPFQQIAYPIVDMGEGKDKSYPIVEIAKLIGADPKNFQFKANMPKTNPNHKNTMFELGWQDDNYIYKFYVYTNWDLRYYRMLGMFKIDHEYQLENQARITDYIRSLKFATPPLIREDFVDLQIPKEELTGEK
jgi:hypothetical protein